MGELAYSEKVKIAQGAVDYVKSQVRYRGLNTMGGWIRHPLEGSFKTGARIASLIKETQLMASYKGPQPRDVIIRDTAKLGRDTGTGNCSELSAIAFEYLRDKGIRPLEYFGVYRGSWNHAFLVLYRDTKIPVANFIDWSPAAVVCDPLYDRAGDAGFLMKWYGHMFPLSDKDMYYRLT